MEILKFFKRHKILLFLICSFILCLTVHPNAAINFPDGTGGSTFSIVFDKRQMSAVNKIEIQTPKGVTIVDDPAFIKEIVDATMVATHAPLDAIFGHYYIRLYKGDILIRNMDLSLYYNLVRVYSLDFKHFLLFGAFSGGGYVFVSDELLEKLQQYLMEHDNSFGGISGSYLYPESPLR